MRRAQGSLEYLIIIAAVLAIAAIVVLFMTGAFKSSSTTAKISECKTEAARCANTLATTDTGYSINYNGEVIETCNTAQEPGNPCYDACTDNGKDILVEGSSQLNAFYYCIMGMPEEVYPGNRLPGSINPVNPVTIY